MQSLNIDEQLALCVSGLRVEYLSADMQAFLRARHAPYMEITAPMLREYISAGEISLVRVKHTPPNPAYRFVVNSS